MTDATALPANAIWLDDLDLSHVFQQWGIVHKGLSCHGTPMILDGVTFQRGMGTHVASELMIDLKDAAVALTALVGVDDEAEDQGSIIFEVWVDDIKRFDSGVIRGSDKAVEVNVNLTGASRLLLIARGADENITWGHANWARAIIHLAEGANATPETIPMPVEAPPPIASGHPAKPQIHGPKVLGCTPGYDFLWMVPVTGNAPMEFKASGLPESLSLNAASGIISGKAPAAGDHTFTVTASNADGEDSRLVKIVSGHHKLAQTPPMGWNSWNVWAASIDDQKVRDAADALVTSGLAAVGYQYINIDDCWEADRDENGKIIPNEKFPDMKALADYVHSKGLKLGIYSSPGPKTCGGFTGSYQHEHLDAQSYADWGFDYLKYDWCSYGEIAQGDSRDEFMKPYIVMRDALDACGRDIVYSLCQYGMYNVWEWGADIGGNCWRTTGDIHDHWYSMSHIGFRQAGLSPYARPGHWNDPDMMVVGDLGWGPNLHPTRLTPNEQLTHVTLWTILASPILLGCDLTTLDQFTLDLLTNHEVIEVHQDALGQPGERIWQDGDLEIWSRPLEDGSRAVGLFNRGRSQESVTLDLYLIGISNTASAFIRDLWLQKDLGKHAVTFETTVPGHGVVFVKVG